VSEAFCKLLQGRPTQPSTALYGFMIIQCKPVCAGASFWHSVLPDVETAGRALNAESKIMYAKPAALCKDVLQGEMEDYRTAILHHVI
jgi:hypothetical protein